jgi:hypothetical protein
VSVETLRLVVTEMKSAHADVDSAVSALLFYERQSTNSFSELHGSLERLGEALQRATTAQRELARVLALDPDKLTSQEPLVAPLIEGTTD